MKIFKFSVDEQFAQNNNELLRDSKRLRNSGLILGLILIIIGVTIFFTVEAAWAFTLGLGFGLFGALVAVVGFLAAKKVGTAQQLYDRYPLAPAVIAEVNETDVVLMALVNTNVDPTLPPRWAASLRTVSNIPGLTERTVGTKIPVAAVSGQRTSKNSEHWDQITPMPIAWGTPDQEVVKIARNAIPSEQWHKLDRARKRLNDIKATRFDLLVL
ncbi:membrane protein [Corynebacterium phocae]|uniref:Membrane protein n=1 Tax=Corynebacterium phocae TaxID=161895 RepID=A0A1L7D4F4_9CORY|nr:DUF3239 domain-containing protein [Corynebacterium phocae]APT93039.1 membrane protein [Corynebacterium phocae]KAA8722530.1 DUF3239 domain-containing protein [Corynebacterium phocae]